jgi:hypothetical protein
MHTQSRRPVLIVDSSILHAKSRRKNWSRKFDCQSHPAFRIPNNRLSKTAQLKWRPLFFGGPNGRSARWTSVRPQYGPRDVRRSDRSSCGSRRTRWEPPPRQQRKDPRRARLGPGGRPDEERGRRDRCSGRKINVHPVHARPTNTLARAYQTMPAGPFGHSAVRCVPQPSWSRYPLTPRLPLSPRHSPTPTFRSSSGLRACGANLKNERRSVASFRCYGQRSRDVPGSGRNTAPHHQ